MLDGHVAEHGELTSEGALLSPPKKKQNKKTSNQLNNLSCNGYYRKMKYKLRFFMTGL